MSYSIIDCFMTAFVCGALFGIVYELFRIIRRILPVMAVTFVCDVCFFICAGFFVFNLSLYLGNYVRIYTILGFGAGVFSYIQTVGRLASVIEAALGKLWAHTFGRLIKKLLHIVGSSIGAFAHKLTANFGRFADFFKRKKKSASTLLQSRHQKLYNSSNDIEKHTGERSGENNVIQASVRRGQGTL
ncbi:MAG: spore cortex biosynthesis protein YabQ [Oscillospiraceae bacterium]|nr:spore cortex biosynthesis protein YabQ [Oscillospiraceae bacterium]